MELLNQRLCCFKYDKNCHKKINLPPDQITLKTQRYLIINNATTKANNRE